MSLLLGFATGMFAIGSKLLPRLAVQTFGIRLIATGFGDRFLVVRAHFSRRRGLSRWRRAWCRRRSGSLRKSTSHPDRERQECRAYGNFHRSILFFPVERSRQAAPFSFLVH